MPDDEALEGRAGATPTDPTDGRAGATPTDPTDGRAGATPTDRRDHASPYPVSRLAPAFDLVDVAREIAQADAMIGAVAGAKLAVIAEQMRALSAEARAILEQARRDVDLHRAKCAFQRRPGHVYHLYRRGADDLYFSLLSPEDWDGKPPHEHVGSYRLEADMSWTPAEAIDARDRDQRAVARLFGGPSGER
jgi:hypothetical protein